MRETKITWYTPEERLPEEGSEVLVVLKIDESITHTEMLYSVWQKQWWLDGETYQTHQVAAWAKEPNYATDEDTDLKGV